jgi:hypothetical protein
VDSARRKTAAPVIVIAVACARGFDLMRYAPTLPLIRLKLIEIYWIELD